MSRLVDALKTVLATNFSLREMTSAEETAAEWQRTGVTADEDYVVIAHVLLPSDDTVVDAVMAASSLENYHSAEAFPAAGDLLFAWDVEMRFLVKPTAEMLEAIAAVTSDIAAPLGGRFDGWTIAAAGDTAVAEGEIQAA